MNALTAPIALLTAPLLNAATFNNLAPGGGRAEGDNAGFFLRSGTLLALIVIVAGLVFCYTGLTGQVVLEMFGNKLTTGAVGVVLVFMGLVSYLMIGRAVLKRYG